MDKSVVSPFFLTHGVISNRLRKWTASARHRTIRLHRSTVRHRMTRERAIRLAAAPPMLTSPAVTCTPRIFRARAATAQRPISQGRSRTNSRRAISLVIIAWSLLTTYCT